jgi:hypothetical protein
VRWTSKVEAVSQRPSSRWRDAQAQHVGRLEVHDQIDPVGLLDWKVFWSGTPQDSGDEAGGKPRGEFEAGSVTEKSALLGYFGKLINRRQTRSIEQSMMVAR